MLIWSHISNSVQCALSCPSAEDHKHHAGSESVILRVVILLQKQ